MAYRGVAPRYSPLSGEGARRFGGRWNPPDEFPAIYLAHPREACLAELRRGIQLAARPARPGPRRLCRLRAHELRVLDLTTDEQLAAVGLTRGDIDGEDASGCQEVGRLTHFLNYQGIHAPSATSAGWVLAVFERRLGPNQLAELDSEDLAANDLIEE